MTSRNIRKNRTTSKINHELPVVSVFRSNKNILAQVTDPATSKVVFTATSNAVKKGTKTEKAAKVGEKIAQFLTKKSLTKAVFNRNGYLYHGRIASLAEAVRNNNIEM